MGKLVDAQRVDPRCRHPLRLGLVCVFVAIASPGCALIDDGDAGAQREHLRREQVSCDAVRRARAAVSAGTYDEAMAELDEAREAGPQNPPTDRARRDLRRLQHDASNEARLVPKVLASLEEATELLCE